LHTDTSPAAGLRIIEATLHSVGAVCLLALSTVGHLFTTASPLERGLVQAIGDALLGMRQEAILAGVLAFCVGSVMYSSVFYRSGMIPRWLAGWGIVGAVLLFAAGMLALWSGSSVTTYTPLIVPVAIQEMVLAAWLIVRGFRVCVGNSAMAPRSLAVE
jgi:hypothetical protein